jgi:hypothetical protein
VYPELARERVRRAVDVVEFDCAVYGGEERAIEPPPALRDQLWDLQRVGLTMIRCEHARPHLIRSIGDAVRRFDIVKDPRPAALRYQFPAQNLMAGSHEKRSQGIYAVTYAILSEVHVRGEDIRACSVLRKK